MKFSSSVSNKDCGGRFFIPKSEVLQKSERFLKQGRMKEKWLRIIIKKKLKLCPEKT